MSDALPPDPALLLLAGALGLAFGSFSNVLAHRLPRGESPLAGRSRCPRCDAPIRARDNLPLLSFALLRGRCRDCRRPISRRYPLVEAGGAAVAVSGTVFVPDPVLLVGWSLFLFLLLTLAVTDREGLTLPDPLTLGGAALGLLLAGPRPDLTLSEALLGALAGFGLLCGLRAIWLRFRDREAIGRGDLKMMLLLGVFLGPAGTLAALTLASASALVVALPLLLLGRIRHSTPLPFGAALAFGGAVSFVTGVLAPAWLPGAVGL